MNLTSNIYGFLALFSGADMLFKLIAIVLVSVGITNIVKRFSNDSVLTANIVARVVIIFYELLMVCVSKVIWAISYSVAFAILEIVVFWFALPVFAKLFYDNYKILTDKKN